MAAGKLGGRLPPRFAACCHLTAPVRSRTTSAEPSSRRSITLEEPHIETPQESLDRLRLEVEELRASRERLVLAADADRRRIERDFHDGPQQHLVALAVNLELARRLADADPAAAKALLNEMGRDVQQALDETGEPRTGSTRPCSRRAASLQRCARRRRAPASRPTSKSRRTRATHPRSRARCTSVVSRCSSAPPTGRGRR